MEFLPEGAVLIDEEPTLSDALPEGAVLLDETQQTPQPQPVATRYPTVQELTHQFATNQMPPDKVEFFKEIVRRSPYVPGSEGVSVGEFLEPMATLATSIAAEPVAGLAGIAQSLNPFAEEGAGARAVESTREALTYKPRTDVGKGVVTELGELAEPVGEAISTVEKGLGDFAFDLTGSPALASVAASSPTALGELFGLHSLKSLRTGTKLLDAEGNATKTLRRHLNKEGLDFDTLEPEVKAAIPEEVGPDLLPSSKPIRAEAKKAVINQIEAGGRDDILAPLMVKGSKVVPDKVATETIRQGFRPGVVQAIKTTSPSTKARMKQMVQIRKKIKGNERAALDMRPDIVIGDEITDRLGFIRDKADAARIELNDIAKNQLPGVNVDPTEVFTTLKDHLDDLGIDLVQDQAGKIKPDFAESLISEDLSSQRAVKSLIRLMSKGGTPDALRFHNMKRELDNLIDFSKKSSTGLSEAGRRVLKDVRHSLNSSLRKTNQRYAEVNDVLSTVIGNVNDLDKAVGSIDILAEGSNKALGTRMRALMSNQQGRMKIENAIENINETAKSLGGNFDVDIKDLVLFDDALNERFGAVARTSLAGQVEQGVGTAITRGPTATILETLGKKVGKTAEKARGINDFSAFESLETLLNR